MAYVGFSKLKSEIAERGGVKNPGAVAAAIGRKKYGRAQFDRAAASGRTLKGARPAKRRSGKR